MIDDLPSAQDPDTATEKAEPDPVDMILSEVRALRSVFDSKIRYDETREQIIDAMGSELEQHRQGAFRMQLRPVLLDLVAMYDDISQMLRAPDCPPETAQRLDLIRDNVLQTLARNGAEQVRSEDDVVDRSLHKVVKIVPTADPEADRRIAARLRPGFRWNERLLRPEWVDVYRYEAPAASVEPQSGEPVAEAPDRTELPESRSGVAAGQEREEA